MVGKRNKMWAIRKKRTVQKYSQQKPNVSNLIVWNVQCALGMFSYLCRCYSKQMSARRCSTAEKSIWTSDGSDRNWKQIMSVWSEQLVRSQQRQKLVFLCSCSSEMLLIGSFTINPHGAELETIMILRTALDFDCRNMDDQIGSDENGPLKEGSSVSLHTHSNFSVSAK